MKHEENLAREVEEVEIHLQLAFAHEGVEDAETVQNAIAVDLRIALACEEGLRGT